MSIGDQIGFINKYKDIAIMCEDKYGIPTEITLAQGLLESAAGTSKLAIKANNFFGIKAGMNDNFVEIFSIEYIDGQKTEVMSKFKRYKNDIDSFEDHGKFLQKDRYKPCFEYSDDYKMFARKLYECGYATDPKYPEKLISLIENLELNKIYEDKNKDHWAKKSFDKMKELGIINGKNNNNFLNDNVTYGQLCVILERFYNKIKNI